jgi:hypothetical protein
MPVDTQMYQPLQFPQQQHQMSPLEGLQLLGQARQNAILQNEFEIQASDRECL